MMVLKYHVQKLMHVAIYPILSTRSFHTRRSGFFPDVIICHFPYMIMICIIVAMFL